MKILILGASGATGKLLVEELLHLKHELVLLLRQSSHIPGHWQSNPNISIVKTNVLELSPTQLSAYTIGCDAFASCLGHNLTWKGIFGKPKKLVRDSIALLCEAILKNQDNKKVNLMLMNTAGNRNRDLNEPISLGERFVISLLRLFLPPHPDNEQAADYLRLKIGQNHSKIEWVVVRPDTLLNKQEVSEYTAHVSPTRSALFNAGETSRINVAHFMAQLINNPELWQQWKGKMPVLYNSTLKS